MYPHFTQEETGPREVRYYKTHITQNWKCKNVNLAIQFWLQSSSFSLLHHFHRYFISNHKLMQIKHLKSYKFSLIIKVISLKLWKYINSSFMYDSKQETICNFYATNFILVNYSIYFWEISDDFMSLVYLLTTMQKKQRQNCKHSIKTIQKLRKVHTSKSHCLSNFLHQHCPYYIS